MSRPLLIGSNNLEKAAELRELLAGLPFEIKSLRDFPTVDEPDETEDTFEGNALLKARYFHNHFGVWTVADDSGLEVDALNGAPGVYSARYAGDNCTYDDNNRKLLNALAEVPREERTARFVCCAAFINGDISHTERGTVEGRIAFEGRGKNGFGYDPLFIPGGHSQTFGELTPDAKHALSHRGQAFLQMRRFLEGLA